MNVYRYTNKDNNLKEREELMEEGRIFDAYQYKIQRSGAYKLIVHTSFDGVLQWHGCRSCTEWDRIPSAYAVVAHFRAWVENYTKEISTTLLQYSIPIREQIAKIKKSP